MPLYVLYDGLLGKSKHLPNISKCSKRIQSPTKKKIQTPESDAGSYVDLEAPKVHERGGGYGLRPKKDCRGRGSERGSRKGDASRF